MCLVTGHPSDSSRMTRKDEEAPKICSSPPIAVASTAKYRSRRLSSWTSSSVGPPSLDPACNWGCLLSGLVALNVLLLGCALISASIFNQVSITSIELQIYLIAIVILSTCWILYYTIYTTREDHAVLYKDGHAGPIWLRGKRVGQRKSL